MYQDEASVLGSPLDVSKNPISMIRVDWWERGLGSGAGKEMRGGAQREHKRC